jgi:hypothetical protein
MKRENNMKKTILSTLVAFGCLLHNLPAAVTFTGTAMVSSSTGNPLGLTTGQVGIWLNKDDASTLWSTLIGTGKIGSGLTLTSDSTYDASIFTVMGSTTVTGTTTKSLSGGIPSVGLVNGITALDQYAVLVFAASTTTTIAGDTYNIWRASDWVIPSDGNTIGYSTTPSAANYTQIRDAGSLLGSGTVVIPEPSSASLLALGVAGLVALRVRRKS